MSLFVILAWQLPDKYSHDHVVMRWKAGASYGLGFNKNEIILTSPTGSSRGSSVFPSSFPTAATELLQPGKSLFVSLILVFIFCLCLCSFPMVFIQSRSPGAGAELGSSKQPADCLYCFTLPVYTCTSKELFFTSVVQSKLGISCSHTAFIPLACITKHRLTELMYTSCTLVDSDDTIFASDNLVILKIGITLLYEVSYSTDVP